MKPLFFNVKLYSIVKTGFNCYDVILNGLTVKEDFRSENEAKKWLIKFAKCYEEVFNNQKRLNK